MKPPIRNARARIGMLIDLVLVEDVHPRMERVEEHRRIDVALVVRAVDGRPVERQVLAPATRIPDAAQRPAPSRTPPWPSTYSSSFQPNDERQQHADGRRRSST